MVYYTGENDTMASKPFFSQSISNNGGYNNAYGNDRSDDRTENISMVTNFESTNIYKVVRNESRHDEFEVKLEEAEKENSRYVQPPILSPASNMRNDLKKKRRILLEYKQLKENSPSGVYILPSLCSNKPRSSKNSWRNKSRNSSNNDEPSFIFYGVIFVRRGIYRNSIFKFRITLPSNYNSHQSFPQVHFFSEVVNPHVVRHINSSNNNNTEYELDLRAESLIGSQWNPRKHALVSVALCIKKIFFMKDFKEPSIKTIKEGGGRGGNYNAWLLWKIDYKGFERKVFECADESQRHVKDDNNSSIKFASHDDEKYQVLRKLMKDAASLKEQSSFGHDSDNGHDKERNVASRHATNTVQSINSDDSPYGIIGSHVEFTRNEILEMVSKAKTMTAQKFQSNFGSWF